MIFLKAGNTRLGCFRRVKCLLVMLLAAVTTNVALSAGLVSNQSNPSKEHPRRIILDVDTGIDDALAIILALQSPELIVEAITVVQGNVPVDVGAENTRRIIGLANRNDLVVAKGAAKPLLRKLITAELIHGENGLGGVVLPETDKKLDSRHAVDVILDIVNANPNEITLVTVGSLTNLALALLKDPGIAKKIPEIILMGGAVTTGNVSPVAEANIFHDAEAAKIVFESGIPITMVGLDVTHQTLLNHKHQALMAKSRSPMAKFAAEISIYYINIVKNLFHGQGGVALHDPLAVAVAIDKSLVTSYPMQVQIVTSEGVAYGQTVVNQHLMTEAVEERDGRLVISAFGRVEPNADVPMQVDRQRFIDMFMTRILASPK